MRTRSVHHPYTIPPPYARAGNTLSSGAPYALRNRTSRTQVKCLQWVTRAGVPPPTADRNPDLEAEGPPLPPFRGIGEGNGHAGGLGRGHSSSINLQPSSSNHLESQDSLHSVHEFELGARRLGVQKPRPKTQACIRTRLGYFPLLLSRNLGGNILN
jgi:hypothetical protein